MRIYTTIMVVFIASMIVAGCVNQAPSEEVDLSLAVPTLPEPVVQAKTFEVSLDEWSVMPKVFKTDAGKVVFLISNDGKYYHEFAVEGNNVQYELPEGIRSEESATLELDLEPGVYKVFDPIPGNEKKGMVAELVVS